MATSNEQYVDLVIRARDEASAKIGLFADNMTAMQTRIANMFSSGAGGSAIAERMNQMEEYRRSFNEELNRQRVGQHPDFLPDLLPPDFSKQLQQRLQKANDVMQAEMQNFNGGWKTYLGQTEEIASTSLNSIWQNFRQTFVGRAGIAGFVSFMAQKVFSEITQAHKDFRESDKGWRDYVNVFAESIPIFGKAMKSYREMVLEITGATEAVENANKFSKSLDNLADIGNRLRNTSMSIGADSQTLARNKALEEYRKILEEIAVEEAKDLGLDFAGKKALALKNLNRTLEEIRSAPLKAMNDELQKQIDLFYKGSVAIAIYEAKLKGANAEELKRITLSAITLANMRDEEIQRQKAQEVEAAKARKHEQIYEEREPFNESLRKKRAELETDIATYRFSEPQRVAMESLKKALTLGIEGEGLERIKRIILDIEAAMSRLEQKKAFDQQKNQLNDFYKTLQEKVQTPVEKYKATMEKMTQAWREKYGPWAKYDAKAMAEYEKLKVQIEKESFPVKKSETGSGRTPALSPSEFRMLPMAMPLGFGANDPAIETAKNTREQKNLTKQQNTAINKLPVAIASALKVGLTTQFVIVTL